MKWVMQKQTMVLLAIGDFSFGNIDSSRDDSDPYFIVSYGFSGSL